MYIVGLTKVAQACISHYERTLQREAESESEIMSPPAPPAPSPPLETTPEPSGRVPQERTVRLMQVFTGKCGAGALPVRSKQAEYSYYKSTSGKRGAGSRPVRSNQAQCSYYRSLLGNVVQVDTPVPPVADGGPSISINPARPKRREVRVRIEYEAGEEGGALRFWDGYAITDNQVTTRKISVNWLIYVFV